MYVFAGGIDICEKHNFGGEQIVDGRVCIVDLDRKKSVILTRKKVIELMMQGMEIMGLELTGNNTLPVEPTYRTSGEVLGVINGRVIEGRDTPEPKNMLKGIGASFGSSLKLINLPRVREWSTLSWRHCFADVPIALDNKGCMIFLKTSVEEVMSEERKKELIESVGDSGAYCILKSDGNANDSGIIHISRLYANPVDKSSIHSKMIEYYLKKGMDGGKSAWVREFKSSLSDKKSDGLMMKQAMLGEKNKVNVLTINGKLTLMGVNGTSLRDASIDIKIPNGIQVVNSGAIRACNKLYIPDSVEQYDSCTRAEKIEHIPDGMKLEGSIYGNMVDRDGNYIKVLEINEKTIGNSGLYRGIFVKNVAVSESISNVNIKALTGNNNVEKIALLSKKPITIGAKGFSDLSNLSHVITPNGKIRRIEAEAFRCCSKLQNIDVSECEYIGHNAFYGCGEYAKLKVSTQTGEQIKYVNWVFNNSVEIEEWSLLPNLGNILFKGKDIKLPECYYGRMPDILGRNYELGTEQWDVTLYYIHKNVGDKLREFASLYNKCGICDSYKVTYKVKKFLNRG